MCIYIHTYIYTNYESGSPQIRPHFSVSRYSIALAEMKCLSLLISIRLAIVLAIVWGSDYFSFPQSSNSGYCARRYSTAISPIKRSQKSSGALVSHDIQFSRIAKLWLETENVQILHDSSIGRLLFQQFWANNPRQSGWGSQFDIFLHH